MYWEQLEKCLPRENMPPMALLDYSVGNTVAWLAFLVDDWNSYGRPADVYKFVSMSVVNKLVAEVCYAPLTEDDKFSLAVSLACIFSSFWSDNHLAPLHSGLC